MNSEKVIQLIESEHQFFNKVHDQWSLVAGPQDMELVAHALRVLLHLGRAADSLPEYEALIRVQHEDGGWGRESNETESAAWVSAFCGLMLIRGNAVLQNPGIEESVWKAIRYFLNYEARVNVRIYDLSGELIDILSKSSLGQTNDEIIWDISDVESGVYLARVEAASTGRPSSVAFIKIAVVK